MVSRRLVAVAAALVAAFAAAPRAAGQVGNAIGTADPKYNSAANAPPTAQLTFTAGAAAGGALSPAVLSKIRAWMNCNIYNSYQANDDATRQMCFPKDQAWTLQGSGVNVGRTGGDERMKRAWIQYYVFSPTVTPQSAFLPQDLCLSPNDLNRFVRWLHEEYSISGVTFSCALDGGAGSEGYAPCLCPRPEGTVGVDRMWRTASIALAVLSGLFLVALVAIGVVRCIAPPRPAETKEDGEDRSADVGMGRRGPMWRL